jgi:hypothetical protein
VCQHVIAACLALVAAEAAAEAPASPSATAVMASAPPSATDSAPAAAAPSPDPAPAAGVARAAAWTSVDQATVRRWAGADHWQHAVALAGEGELLPAQREGGALVVRFRDGIEARLPPGAVLDALITSAPARLQRRFLAAAVIAARRDEGWLPELAAAAGFQLPSELLRSLQAQLVECARLGLNRLTASTRARLETVAVQCRAAGLHRAGRELAACAEEVRWIHARDAGADPERLLDRVARLSALVEALLAAPGAARPALLGAARSEYHETTALTLVGCGAYGWRTASGFHGLTLLFWIPSSGQFASWSDSRPVGSGDGFEPRRRFGEEAPWPGGGTVERLSRSRCELLRPRLNDQRRLSSSAASRVTAIAEPRAAELPAAERSWAALRQRFAALPTLGLEQPAALDHVVRLQPQRFTPARFDEIEQRLVWPLEDQAGDQLVAMVPFLPHHAGTIQWIERYRPAAGDSLVGYFQAGANDSFQPVARIGGGDPPAIESIGFTAEEPERAAWWQRLLARRPAPAWSPPTAEVDEANAGRDMTPLRQLLAPAREHLLQVAESGLVSRPAAAREGETLAADLAAAGLIALSQSLRRATASPLSLLRAAYQLHLYWEAG